MDNIENKNLGIPVRDLAGKRLLSGQYLGTNEYIVSENLSFFAIMQGDGNFGVYQGTGPGDNRGYLWASRMTAGAGSYIALMQGDGNFGVYRGTSLKDIQDVLWHAGGSREGTYFQLRLFDNGNLVLAETWNADIAGTEYWSSNATAVVLPSFFVDLETLSEPVNPNESKSGPLWQSFVPLRSGLLLGIDLKLLALRDDFGLYEQVILSVYEGQGTGGRLLAEQEITVPYYFIEDEQQFTKYLFTTPPYLNGNVRYSMHVRSKDCPAGPHAKSGRSILYPAGTCSRGTDTAILFRTYMRVVQPKWNHPVG